MGIFDDNLLYPGISALVAAMGPAGARAVGAFDRGLQLQSVMRQRDEQAQRDQKLRDILPQIFGQTNTVETPAALPPSDRMDLAADAELPDVQPTTSQPLYNTTKSTPVFSPRLQALGKAVGEVDPRAALSLATRGLQEKEDFKLGPGEAYYRGGEIVAERPALPPRPTTPPRPVYHTAGGETIASVYNPATGGWDERRAPVAPAPATPPRELSDIERQNIQNQIDTRNARLGLERQNTTSQVSERNARITRLQNITQKASDPKATLGQLSSSLNALVRERDSIETPDEDKQEIQTAIQAIRSRIAEVGGGAAAGQGGTPSGMPDPKKHKGKTGTDTATGTRYQSDGTKWVPIGKITEY